MHPGTVNIASVIKLPMIIDVPRDNLYCLSHKTTNDHRCTQSQPGTANIASMIIRYEVFPLTCMHVRHPFGSLLGVIQTDDAYVSWLGLQCSPTNQVHRQDRCTTQRTMYNTLQTTHYRQRTTGNENIALVYTSICTCTYAYLYHIKTGLKIWGVSINTYAYPSSDWIATRSNSAWWCIHLLTWAIAGSPLLMTCIANKTHYASHNALWTNGSTALVGHVQNPSCNTNTNKYCACSTFL